MRGSPQEEGIPARGAGASAPAVVEDSVTVAEAAAARGVSRGELAVRSEEALKRNNPFIKVPFVPREKE